MFPLRSVLCLLLACASAVAQIPLVASDHEIREVALTASATPDVLVVELAIAEGWHGYSRDVGGGNPVTVELADDCDFVVAGELKVPTAHDGKVTGKVRWELPIKTRGDGVDLRAVVWFQICDELECFAPARVELSGNPKPIAVLVVVDAADGRSARIKTFLTERGCKVSVTTYEEVKAADCDAHDLVLADSKLFRKGKRVRNEVLAFPQTETPIIAVGFYGTELIEAHTVAMTSGYI
jgi:hypothetical protein